MSDTWREVARDAMASVRYAMFLAIMLLVTGTAVLGTWSWLVSMLGHRLWQ